MEFLLLRLPLLVWLPGRGDIESPEERGGPPITETALFCIVFKEPPKLDGLLMTITVPEGREPKEVAKVVELLRTTVAGRPFREPSILLMLAILLMPAIWFMLFM